MKETGGTVECFVMSKLRNDWMETMDKDIHRAKCRRMTELHCVTLTRQAKKEM